VRELTALRAPAPGSRARPPDAAYLLLGVVPGASRAEALAAYKRQAMRWHPDRNFGNRGEAEERFKAVVGAYEQINDWLAGEVVEQAPVLAIQRRFRRAAAGVVQRFGIDDRRWGEVTSATLLGATAYELATAKGESVVVKRAGVGRLEYDPTSEGPVQEALAAKLGEIEGLGVATARTVLIETGGAEGQEVLKQLQGLGSADSRELAEQLARTQVFLVMQRAPGRRADKAQEIVTASRRDERLLLFYRLGRLWAFDVLVNNTDRFYGGNWGNVILGPRGSVVGIDQMVGLTASDLGASFAADEAVAKLKVALDPDARRRFALETFRSLSRHLGPAVYAFEGEFVRQFERGTLEGIDAIARLDPRRLAEQLAALPEFARAVAGQIGLGGAAAIQATFADSRSAVGKQLDALYNEIGERERLASAIDDELAKPRRLRDDILERLHGQAETLTAEWNQIAMNWFGKDAHWGQRAKELAALRELGRDEFIAASKVRARSEDADWALQAQLKEWRNGLTRVWQLWDELTQPLESAHDKIKPLVARLAETVQQERSRVALVDVL
jgi:hypothetical protein